MNKIDVKRRGYSVTGHWYSYFIAWQNYAFNREIFVNRL